jgi:IstB-like ATP binding protein
LAFIKHPLDFFQAGIILIGDPENFQAPSCGLLAQRDQAETSVLFELSAARYERRSLAITANQPFGEWGKIFPDQAMTIAAIDRLVLHATIFEMNVDSYRRKTAIKKTQGPGRPATRATTKSSS